MGSDVAQEEGIIRFEWSLRFAFVMLPILLLIPLAWSARLVRRNKSLGFVSISVLVAIFAHLVFVVCPLFVEQLLNKSDMPLPERYMKWAENSSAEFIAASDLHSDALLWFRRDLLTRSAIGHVDVPRLEQGNVRLQVFAIVVAVPRGMNFLSNARPRTLLEDLLVPKMILERWPLSSYRSHLKRTLLQCSRLKKLAAQSNGRLRMTAWASQLKDASLAHQKERASAVHAILAVEGASALEHDVANVDTLFNAGLRVLGPAHFYDTEVGGSLSGVEKYGLTEFGRRVLIRMRHLGMVVDLAHASNSLIEDVTALATEHRPCLLLSHTGVRSVCNVKRNIDDDQLRRIASVDGLVGIGLFYPAVCDKDDLLGSFVKSVVHAVRSIGVEHVALGSDFDGCVHTSVDAGDMPVIFTALVHVGGLNESEAHMIMYENTLNFFRRCLPP